MKTYGGVHVQIDVLLTLEPAGGEWSASCHGRFPPGKRGTCTHSIGRRVGPRTGLEYPLHIVT
jgi:hypothetical protein